MFDLQKILNKIPIAWLRRRPQVEPDTRQYLLLEKIRGYLSSIGNQARFFPLVDSYTEETAEIRNAYRVMLRDPYVKAALFTKTLAVAALDPQTNPASDSPADKEGADLVKYALLHSKGSTRKIAYAVIIHALIDGYSVSEKLWKVGERGKFKGKILLRDVKPRDTRHLVLEGDAYRNITGVRDLRAGQTYHPSNFVIWQNLPLFDSPVGMSDLRAAFRAFWLIDSAWRLRAIGMERFGLPILAGYYVRSEEQILLAREMENLRSQSWITLPEGARIEALDIASRSQPEFDRAIEQLREEIVIGIAGATLQMLQGQVADGRGSSEVHKSTTELFQWYLAAEVGSVISDQIVPDLIAFNHPDADHPLVTLGGVNDQQMTATLAVDEGLKRLGLDLSKEEMYRKYGRQQPMTDEDALKAQSAGPTGGDGMALPFAENGNGQLKSSEVAELQKLYFAGEISQDAAVAHAVVVWHMDTAQAQALFPQPEEIHQDRKEGEQAVDGIPGPAPKGNGVAALGGGRSLPFDEGPAPTQIAGSHQDLDTAGKLLQAAQKEGSAVLARLAASAARRLLGDYSASAKELFTDEERSQLADAIARCQASANLLGRARVRKLAEKAKANIEKFSDQPVLTFAELKPLAPLRAIAWFRARVPGLKVNLQQFSQGLRRQAFTLAGVTEKTLLEKVHGIIASALESGEVAKEQPVKQIERVLEAAGVTASNPSYPSMVFRTNVMQAFNQGASEEMRSPDVADLFPVWRYLGVKDGRQRPAHEKHFGKYFPASVSFAEVRDSDKGEFDGYSCRCVPQPVSKFAWRRLQSQGVTLSRL